MQIGLIEIHIPEQGYMFAVVEFMEKDTNIIKTRKIPVTGSETINQIMREAKGESGMLVR